MGSSKVKGKQRVHESPGGRSDPGLGPSPAKLSKKVYATELVRLQEELV
jgi:hypothetical protein